MAWAESDLKSAVLSFQEHYEGQAALILWLASGRTRIGMDLADEEYFWRFGAGGGAGCLWAVPLGGAEADVPAHPVPRRGIRFDGEPTLACTIRNLVRSA